MSNMISQSLVEDIARIFYDCADAVHGIAKNEEIVKFSKTIHDSYNVFTFCHNTYMMAQLVVKGDIEYDVYVEQTKNALRFAMNSIDKKFHEDEFLSFALKFRDGFDQIIKKVEVNSQPEATGDYKPLDNYAFGQRRSDVPYEKDNAQEVNLFQALRSHFNGSGMIDDKNAKLIKDILASDQYGKIFRKPKDKILYRGMRVTQKYLTRVIGDNVSPAGSKKAKFIFDPYNGKFASSWTDKIQVAEDFSFSTEGVSTDEKSYAIIMSARSDDNPNCFAAGPEGLYNIDEFNYHRIESEYVGLGQIQVYEINWMELL